MRVAERKAAVQTPVITKEKEAEKARVIHELLKPLGRVAAWASRTQNAEAEAAAGVSFSTLNQVPDAEIMDRLEALMTLMRGVIAQVPKVTAAQLDALDEELSKLEPMLGSPRSKIVDREAANAEMERERRAARLVLENQHDRLVRGFNHAEPGTPAQERERAFFDRWAPAREIVDAPTHHKTAPTIGGAPSTPAASGGSGAGTAGGSGSGAPA